MNAFIARLSATLLCLAVSTTAGAVIPESGLWWNPQEPGRGYTIELQDDGMFVAYYAYQPDGTRSAFYTSFGRLDARTGEMRGDWHAAENGQCFGCPHRAPELVDLGESRLVFTSPVTGHIHLPGDVQIPIERMPLVGEHRHDPVAMLGVWSVVDGATVYFGDQLWFRQTTDAIDDGFAGHRVGSSQRLLLGGPTNDSALPPMLVLLDSSASYYTAYAFDNSYNRWVGRSWTYPKTGQLSGAGLPSVAHRLIGNAHASQSSATSNPAKALVPDTVLEDAELRDAARHEAGLSRPKSNTSGQIKIGERWYDEDAVRIGVETLLRQAESP